MNQKDNHNKESRGQSLVEFAVSLVILLLLVAGVFDGARALFTYLSMRDAAQEGALFASIDPGNNTEIRERTYTGSSMVDDLRGDMVVDISYSGDPCMGNGNSVTITIQYPEFPLTMPFIGAAIGSSGNTIPITASIIDSIIAPPCE